MTKHKKNFSALFTSLIFIGLSLLVITSVIPTTSLELLSDGSSTTGTNSVWGFSAATLQTTTTMYHSSPSCFAWETKIADSIWGSSIEWWTYGTRDFSFTPILSVWFNPESLPASVQLQVETISVVSNAESLASYGTVSVLQVGNWTNYRVDLRTPSSGVTDLTTFRAVRFWWALGGLVSQDFIVYVDDLEVLSDGSPTPTPTATPTPSGVTPTPTATPTPSGVTPTPTSSANPSALPSPATSQTPTPTNTQEREGMKFTVFKIGGIGLIVVGSIGLVKSRKK